MSLKKLSLAAIAVACGLGCALPAQATGGPVTANVLAAIARGVLEGAFQPPPLERRHVQNRRGAAAAPGEWQPRGEAWTSQLKQAGVPIYNMP